MPILVTPRPPVVLDVSPRPSVVGMLVRNEEGVVLLRGTPDRPFLSFVDWSSQIAGDTFTTGFRFLEDGDNRLLEDGGSRLLEV